MNKTIFSTIIISVVLLFSFTACDDETSNIQLYDYTVQVEFQENVEVADLSGITVTLINTNTLGKMKATTDRDGKAYFTNLVGIYNIEVSTSKARIYTFQDNDGTVKTDYANFAGIAEQLVFSDKLSNNLVLAKIKIENKGLVIKEMYTASTKTLNGGSLRFDQFIEIYNNTDTTHYLDGLCIGETRHQTSSRENIHAAEMGEKTFLWTIYSIPGKNGEKKYPLEPGKSIIIAPQPIDHRENNSIDLRPPVADWQWYDAFGTGQFSIDVPEVPNLVRYYSYSLSVWVVTVRMNRGFVIFKVPEGLDMNTFILENTDIRLNNAGKPVTSIGVLNEYIYDAVELGNKNEFYYKSLDSSLDSGFSYTLDTYNGKSIRRKINYIADDGRVVYEDTNNSTLDFWTSRTPSPKQYPTDDEIDHE